LDNNNIEIDPRTAGLLAFACVATLVPMNWSWYAWAREIPGSLPFYILAGSAVYFVLLRALTGVRFASLSYETRFIVLSSMLLLILFLAFGRSDTFRRLFLPSIPKEARTPLLGFGYFVTSSVVLRFVVPYLLIRFKLKQPPRLYGYVVRGGTRMRWVYLGLFIAMVPLVIWAASLPDFQTSYPQTPGIVRGDTASLRLFVIYHVAYFLLFLSGESFWRGYMTFGIGRDLDVAGLPWMVMMYSIGHYGKPILEVQASIIAGFVLGYLALRHRSFFLGAVLHWGIALTMDLAVLWHRGITWQ
jgi:membrane protease YdiL (CAAX protease family)